jgi:hypothetical protein
MVVKIDIWDSMVEGFIEVWKAIVERAKNKPK